MKVIVYVLLFFIGICYIHPESLEVKPEDILIEENADGGYHLWIRSHDGVGSVMITESTADPLKKNAVYALRAKEYNTVNGSEKRILDGKEIDPSRGLYFLIDSTPEPHEEFGNAFHIFIPYVAEFGYPWSRNGEIYVSAGTFLNIRSFAKEYGDYSTPFRDNPFVLDIIQVPLAVPPENIYMDEAVKNFSEIASLGGGEVVYSGDENLVEDIGKIIDLFDGPTIDLVFAIDTTESMRNDIDMLRSRFPAMIAENIEKYEKARLGLLYYKDYNEEYLTKPHPFTEDPAVVKAMLNSARVWGGKDRPEAVYEALYDCVTWYEWEADDRVVILIGDAPAHPKQRGKISRDMVFEEAGAKDVTIYTIILPP